MIRLDVEQGSPEWIAVRLGIPTASQFNRIMTAKTHKPSSAQEDYVCELIAERILKQSLDPFVSDWMERGAELEPMAVAYYEMQTDREVEKVGHCLTDDRSAGCSPDGLVGDDGGLEIKCPAAKTHISYMIGGKHHAKYLHQVQGGLWITGREWWDFLSFHPELPPVLKRFHRDEEYIGDLAECVNGFCERLDREMRSLNLGEAKTPLEPDPVFGDDWKGPKPTQETEDQDARLRRAIEIGNQRMSERAE